MPALLARAPMRRVTVLTVVVALVLSMLTLFTAPAARAQEAPPAQIPAQLAPAAPTDELDGLAGEVPGGVDDSALEEDSAPEDTGAPMDEQPPTHAPSAARVTSETDPAALASIAGRISLPAEARGEEARWYAALSVRAQAADGWDSVDTAVSADGTFEFLGLDADQYVVTVHADKRDPAAADFVNLPELTYWDGASGARLSARIPVTESGAEPISITLPLGRTITGTVTLPAGTDPGELTQVSVRAERLADPDENFLTWETSATELVTEDGSYRLSQLSPGVHRIVADTYSMSLVDTYFPTGTDESAAELVDVTDGDQQLRPILMMMGRTITGSIVLPAGVDPGMMGELSVTVERLVSRADADPAWSWAMSTWVHEDGSFVFAGLVPGEYRVLATGENTPLLESYFPGVLDAESAERVDVSSEDRALQPMLLELGRTMTGQLLPPEGAPENWAEAVDVSVTREGGGGARAAVIDDTGAFVVTGLGPGKYRLHATADTLRLNMVSRFYPGNTVLAENAGTIEVVDALEVDAGQLQLTAGAILSGTVTLPSGAPREWLSALSITPKEEQWDPHWTDGSRAVNADPTSGAYMVMGLESGAYTLEFQPGTDISEGVPPSNLEGRYLGDARRFGEARFVWAELGEEVSGLDQHLPLGAVIRGTVTVPTGTDPQSLDGVRLDARLTTERDDFAPGSVQVDPHTGGYEILGLAPGEYLVQADVGAYSDDSGEWVDNSLVSRYYAPDSRGLRYHDAQPIELTAAQTYSEADLVLEQGYTISGSVSLESGIPEPWIEGVAVSATGRDDETTELTLHGDVAEDGNYRITGVPRGDYLVQFAPDTVNDAETGEEIRPNLLTQYYPGALYPKDAQSVTIDNADQGGIDAVMQPGRTISGTITLPPRASVEDFAHIRVVAQLPSTLLYAEGEVRRDGTYEITGLNPGAYEVSVQVDHDCTGPMQICSGPEIAEQTFTVNTAQATQVTRDITLASTSQITGTVSLPSGANREWLRGVLVEASPSWNVSTGNETRRTVRVDPQTGAYKLTHLPQGTYDLHYTVHPYTGPGGQTYPSVLSSDPYEPRMVSLGADPVAGVDVTLRAATVFSGTITGLPQGAQARVELTNREGSGVGDLPVRVGADGSFAFAAVPSGEYLVRLTTDTSVQYLADARGVRVLQARAGTDQRLELVAQRTTARFAGGGEGLRPELLMSVGIYEQVEGTWALMTWIEEPANTAGIARYESPLLAPGTYSAGFSYSTEEWESELQFWDRQMDQKNATPIVLLRDQRVNGINLKLTQEPQPKPFDAAPVPTIQGTAKVGVKLTAKPGAWKPAPKLSYQWLRDGKAVSGATKAEYTPVAADAGTKLSVRVTGTKDGYEKSARVSVPVTVAKADVPKPPTPPKPPVKPAVKKPFADIPANRKFAKEINWMYASGLSTGSKVGGKIEYQPMQKVSREAMAAFLYRHEHASSKGLARSPFVDVQPGHKFYKEISWMYEQGLSTGTMRGGKRYYDPKDSVSREAMAAFLYRLTGKGAKPGAGSPFADIPAGRKFAKEINWMHASGLSTGTKTGTTRVYKPMEGVSREAMAAFLYRMQ